MDWKPVVGFEGLYSVSNTGLVCSEKTGQVKATKRNNRGYVQVALYKENKEHMHLLHRVVATAFVPNENELPQVNHIDQNKENNNASNLEWCTNLYNRRYGDGYTRSCEKHDYKAIARHNGKPVKMYDTQSDHVATFASVMIAQEITGISESNIRQACYNKRKSAGGFLWKYCDKENGERIKARAVDAVVIKRQKLIAKLTGHEEPYLGSFFDGRL